MQLADFLLSSEDKIDAIILDVPECQGPVGIIPVRAEIIMDGKKVFKGPVKLDKASGKVKINIRTNNESLKAILASNAKLAPFQFNLYTSEALLIEPDISRSSSMKSLLRFTIFCFQMTSSKD